MANVKDLEIQVSEAMVLENAQLRAKVANQRLQLKALHLAISKRNWKIAQLRKSVKIVRIQTPALIRTYPPIPLGNDTSRIPRHDWIVRFLERAARLFGREAC